jgi:hypothetical protein
MNRFRLGFRFAGASWRVVRTERSLLAFPILSLAFALAYLLVVVAPVGAVLYFALKGLPVAQVVTLFLMLLGLSVGSTFFGVAAASNAAKAFDGGDPSIGEGIRVAWSRFGVIFKWALVSATVGTILRSIGERGGVAGAIVQAVGGAAWSIASFFALPILALEGLGPWDTLKRSVGVVREKWGESLAGGAAVGLATGLIALGGIGVVVLGVVAGAHGLWPLGLPLIVIGVLVFIAAALVGSVIRAVFTVAVYRFAVAGVVPAGFDAAELEQAFRTKPSRS